MIAGPDSEISLISPQAQQLFWHFDPGPVHDEIVLQPGWQPCSRRFRLPSVRTCQNHVAGRSCHSVFFLLTVGDPTWPLP